MVLLGSLLSRKIIFYFEDIRYFIHIIVKNLWPFFPLLHFSYAIKENHIKLCHQGQTLVFVKRNTNIMYNFHIIKIHYLGLSFLGHPQNYKYYNITFVIFHNVIIKYSVIQILHIFPYKVVQYSVIRILPIFTLQSCTIFGHPNISSIFCLLIEVDYTCYQQHIIILFVLYFVNSFIFALMMHREY